MFAASLFRITFGKLLKSSTCLQQIYFWCCCPFFEWQICEFFCSSWFWWFQFKRLIQWFKWMCFCFWNVTFLNALKCVPSFSCSSDKTNDFILKNSAHELALPLSVFFDKCFHECYLPDSWKLANVVPIPKGKNNFRSIFLSPCVSRIFERISITKSFFPFISSLNPYQFGFLPSGAAIYLRFHVLEHIAVTLAFDLKKIFDLVKHFAILSCL